MKIIKIKRCSDCPHNYYDDGGGFTESFRTCEDGRFVLSDLYIEDGESRLIDLDNEIHPKCRLEDADE